jgi:hypothetical protein
MPCFAQKKISRLGVETEETQLNNEALSTEKVCWQPTE